jgi:serine/threonine protein kinase
MPLARRGRLSTVYRLRLADGRQLALRVLPFDLPELKARYEVAREYLQQQPVPGIVGFRYVSRAVRLDQGEVLPVVAMDWAPGALLSEWVADRAERGAAADLARLAGRWLEQVRQLAAHNLVHGDLEPDNIVIDADGRLTLLDYDGLTPPALLGQPSPETGTPPFQHPGRTPETPMFDGIDHYSALVIYVALRALAADPLLWRQHRAGEPGRELLFHADDLAKPDRSPLMQQLLRSPDGQLRDLAHYLASVWRGPLAQVPDIDEVLLWCNSVEKLLGAGDFDRATQLVERLGSQEVLEAALLPRVDDAFRRVTERRALAAALTTDNLGEIQRCCESPLLEGYPAARLLVEQAHAALLTSRVLTILADSRASGHWNVFRDTWDNYADRLCPLPAAEPFRRDRAALAELEQFEQLAAGPTQDDAGIEAAFSRLDLSNHPDFIRRANQSMSGRLARMEALLELERLANRSSRQPTFEHDLALKRHWRRKGWQPDPRGEPFRNWVRSATQRVRWVRRLNRLAGSPTLAGEQRIAACMRHLPSDYLPKLARRTELARRRVEQLRLLDEALREPVSDLRLATIGAALAKLKALSLLSTETKERIALAVQRAALIARLQEAIEAAPPECDERLLSEWNAELLAPCSDADWLAPYLNMARSRAELLERLRVASDDDDEAAVACLMIDPLLADWPLKGEVVVSHQGFAERQAAVRRQRRQTLEQALVEHDAALFRNSFDRELVAELATERPHHRRTLDWLIQQEILPLQASGLAHAMDGSLHFAGQQRWRATWVWPAARIAIRCRMIVTKSKLLPHANPDDLAALYDAVVERRPFVDPAPTIEFAALPEWDGASVYVWAIVEIGSERFYSEPLAVGRLSAAE